MTEAVGADGTEKPADAKAQKAAKASKPPRPAFDSWRGVLPHIPQLIAASADGSLSLELKKSLNGLLAVLHERKPAVADLKRALQARGRRSAARLSLQLPLLALLPATPAEPFPHEAVLCVGPGDASFELWLALRGQRRLTVAFYEARADVERRYCRAKGYCWLLEQLGAAVAFEVDAARLHLGGAAPGCTPGCPPGCTPGCTRVLWNFPRGYTQVPGRHEEDFGLLLSAFIASAAAFLEAEAPAREDAAARLALAEERAAAESAAAAAEEQAAAEDQTRQIGSSLRMAGPVDGPSPCEGVECAKCVLQAAASGACDGPVEAVGGGPAAQDGCPPRQALDEAGRERTAGLATDGADARSAAGSRSGGRDATDEEADCGRGDAADGVPPPPHPSPLASPAAEAVARAAGFSHQQRRAAVPAIQVTLMTRYEMTLGGRRVTVDDLAASVGWEVLSQEPFTEGVSGPFYQHRQSISNAVVQEDDATIFELAPRARACAVEVVY